MYLNITPALSPLFILLKSVKCKEVLMIKSNCDAMIKEAMFTGEMLCSGYTQIRKANYAKRGVYFQAFTSLSTGFERIGKICYILTYAINNNSFPSYDHIKKSVGHDIEKLYKNILDFKNQNNIQYHFKQDLEDSIYQKIIYILSRFGKGDRYANIDLLVEHLNYDDPISVWFNDIDMYLFNSKISDNKKKKIQDDAMMVHTLLSPYSTISFTAEDGGRIDEIFKGSYRTGVNDAVAPLRQLYIFHIIRFFVESISSLEKIITSKHLFEVPSFMDVFRVFFNEDRYMKTRKTIDLI